ncbi:MAG: gliding motility lipoprotein GldH [Bacteroidales bacterium]|nr:gliding motility lipoprotein GldH [Bacteroidales bacterium]
MATGKKIIRYSLLIMAVMSVAACQSDILYSEYINFEKSGWNQNQTARFAAEITDTLSAASVDIALRTGSDYPYRNIYLFVSTYAPGGMRITDTLEYMIADEKGNRFGKGAGNLRELDLKYRTNVYFPTAGTYLFVIEHAMRKETLEGIYDIGVKIRKEKVKRE